jgi:Rhodopirellula transposase DDE domain
MFCHITQNWRGQPLRSRAIVVNLISHTTTKAGLQIQAELDANAYKTGCKVSDEEFAAIRLEKATFHGEWNYTIAPKV